MTVKFEIGTLRKSFSTGTISFCDIQSAICARGCRQQKICTVGIQYNCMLTKPKRYLFHDRVIDSF